MKLSFETADCIRPGEVKSIDVVKAPKQRAVNSSIEFTEEKLPLLGVTIIKDCFGLKEYENAVELNIYKGKINERTHPLISLLQKSGAIPFCSTRVCQFMGSLGSSNSHGATLNPYSKVFTSGGSSSGEGALIGSNGSLLGIGNDFGGSIRVPSSYCGIYGLKTTPRRIIEHMERSPAKGFESILPATGPMASHVKDIDLTLRAILNSEPWKIYYLNLNHIYLK